MSTSTSIPGVSKKILLYLNKIEEGAGRAKRMDFLRIAGNEASLNDWVEYLIRCNLIRAEAADSKMSYMKTELGERVHAVLKVHYYLGPLLSDLSRNRRRPK